MVLCVAMLQEVIDAKDGDDAAGERSEMEELKLLLPEIRERVEDAKESQRTSSTASQAIQQTLVSTQKEFFPLSADRLSSCRISSTQVQALLCGR